MNVKLHDKLKRDNVLIESLRERSTEASSSYRKSKAVSRKKHMKLLKYCERPRSANKAISTMKKDLGENAIDRFVIFEECYGRDRDIFDQAVVDLKAMLDNIYPDFDFSEFHTEVAKA